MGTPSKPPTPSSGVSRDTDEELLLANATMAGVAKKLATNWRKIDRIVICVAIFIINFVVGLDGSSTSTIQPTVLSEFKSLTKVGLIATVNYLLIAGVRPIFSKICDVFGHLQMLFLAMLLHTVGFVISACSQNFNTLFAGTVISVLGQAGYSVLAAILVAEILPLHLRGVINGYVSVPLITSYYLGIEVGKGLEKKWHWVYILLAILAVVCSMPLLFSLFRLDRRARKTLKEMNQSEQPAKAPLKERFLNVLMELDIPGLLLLCGGLVSILAPLSMQLNISYGWGSARVIAPLVIGVVALLSFVYYEKKVATFPVIPFRLLKIRTFSCAILAATFFYFTSNVSLFYFNPYIQVTREVSSHTAQLLQLGSTGYYLGVIIGGWCMQYWKRYRRFAWMGWVVWTLAVGLMLHSRGGSGTTNAEIAVVQALYGVGSGVVIGCVGIGVQASVSKVDIPIAVTLYGTVSYLGGVLGEGTSTTIYVNLLRDKLMKTVDSSVDVALAMNDLVYYAGLPKDQRDIIKDGYVATQKVLTICGICSMIVAGLFMLGLAPYDLSTKTDEEDNDEQMVAESVNSSSKVKATVRKIFG